MRPMLALYIGGMGARGANFHYDVFARLGYEEECAHIQDLYLQGKKQEAMAVDPDEAGPGRGARSGRWTRSKRKSRSGRTPA